MLRRIKINNYKMFKNFEMEFADGVTLVCGPNGSGKSALRELLFTIGKFLAMPDVTQHVAESVVSAFPLDVYCRWSPQKNGYVDININLVLDSEDKETGSVNVYIYDLTVRYDFFNRKSKVQDESLTFGTKDDEIKIVSFSGGELTIYTDNGKRLDLNADQNISGLVTASRNNNNIKKFGVLISRLYAVHLDPKLIALDFTVGSQMLGAYGENFTAWNFHKANYQLQKQITLFEQCKNFIPGFIAANSHPVGDAYRYKINIEYNYKTYDLALSELSDGQKILFALYSILINVPDDSTIMIDEPENFLAPSELQPWLNAVNDAYEERNIQFILITHNPKTLNWYHSEAVIFNIVDEPPRIKADKYNNDTNQILYEKLCEMEWLSNGS